MNLIIDVGNSIAKLAVFEQAELREKTSVEIGKVSGRIKDYLLTFPEISHIVISNVSAAGIDFPQAIDRRIKILHLSSKTPLPFTNKYASPHTLGNDRKALVAAAVKQYPGKNVLVIDAGSCITYDFKNRRDEYLGGGISPGLKMRFLALNTFTANLPLVELGEDIPFIGDSTVNSIKTGVVNGILKEIEGIVKEYSNEYENLVTIITGGDGTFLSINLKNGIFANSNFLLEGLNYILEFNIDQ